MLFTYERIQRLNDLEFNVYSTILKFDNQISSMKIRTLADCAHVSTTVVLNFCKKMDCKGWVDFKIKYVESIFVNDKKEDKSYEPIIQYFDMYEESRYKKDKIEEVIRYVCLSRRVVFIGAGPSGVLAKYAALYLSNMGKTAQYIDSPYYSIPEENFDGTVVIALSVSGETKNVIYRLIRLKSLRAKVVSITNSMENTTSKLADISIAYHVPQEEFSISEKGEDIRITSTTQIPVLHIIEILGRGVHKYLSIKS